MRLSDYKMSARRVEQTCWNTINAIDVISGYFMLVQGYKYVTNTFNHLHKRVHGFRRMSDTKTTKHVNAVYHINKHRMLVLRNRWVITIPRITILFEGVYMQLSNLCLNLYQLVSTVFLTNQHQFMLSYSNASNLIVPKRQ